MGVLHSILWTGALFRRHRPLQNVTAQYIAAQSNKNPAPITALANNASRIES
jgi:hypothetical protein